VTALTRVVLRHLIQGVLTLFGITVLSFLLGHIAPGDPAYAVLASDGVSAPTEDQLQEVRRALGLDRSLGEQYLLWLGQLLRGNVGVSFMTNRRIEQELLLRIPVTVQLSVLAIMLLIAISVPLGLYLAMHKDSLLDRVFLAVTSAFSAIPGFIVALVLVIVFAETLRLFPTSGYRGLTSLILPALAISMSSATQITRVLRADLLTAFGEEYFEMARAKGFSFRFAAAKHALPNAMASVLPLWGNYFIGILGGSTIAESIFALPGLGQWILKSINSHDYPAIQAYVVVMGVCCLVIFLVVDVLQLLIQPRVRKTA
jgi:nickel transport system permease protein nikB